MATLKNHLSRDNPTSILRSMRCSSPLNSSYSAIQNILPNILTTNVANKRRVKKRVRFALTLESIEEDPLPPENPRISSATAKSNRRTIDPWREDGFLYGAYVEYLQKQEPAPAEILARARPSRPLLTSPEPEYPTFTTTCVLPTSKPSEAPVDLISLSPSPPTSPQAHLPRIVERGNVPKKFNPKKPVLPPVHSPSKQRLHVDLSTRPASSKKFSSAVTSRAPSITSYSSMKRPDLALPSVSALLSHEKLVQGDRPFSAKLIHDYFQSKKFTEVITNPLPGVNNQIHPTPERSALPNLPRKTSTQSSSRTTDELYFFQNYRPDHCAPIIH